MGPKVKVHVDGRSKAARKEARQKLGALKDLTVQPKTRARYNKALERFFQYLKERDLELPRRKALLDPLVSDYVEFL